MNKEDILTEIGINVLNNKYAPNRSDRCSIEEQEFRDEVIDNIECYYLSFSNCKFTNVKFLDNKIEWIEFEECEFENCVFSGIYENVLLTIMDSCFSQCEVKDFVFKGYDAQSEIIRCKFDYCQFNCIRVEADLSILSGEIISSEGIDLSGKMNIVMSTKTCDSSFQEVDIQAAIMKNSFRKTEFNHIKIEEDSVVKDNMFEDCYLDNKLMKNGV